MEIFVTNQKTVDEKGTVWLKVSGNWFFIYPDRLKELIEDTQDKKTYTKYVNFTLVEYSGGDDIKLSLDGSVSTLPAVEFLELLLS